MSLGLIGSLVFMPAWWVLGRADGSALTLGVTAGYFGYAVTHHAVHHWRSGLNGLDGLASGWLRRRKVWHAAHHLKRASGAATGHYGVSLSLWDAVFKTDRNTDAVLIKT